MAKEKAKRVSINALEKALFNVHEHEIVIDGTDDVKMIVRDFLPLTDVLVFVREVAESVVDMEEGVYRPEMYDYMMRYCLMTIHANLTLPKDPEKAYDLMYNTPVIEQIKRIVGNTAQYKNIEGMIENKIVHNLEIIERSVEKQVREYLNMMEQFTNSVAPLFEDMDADKVAEFFNRMSEEERIDERALVEAFRETQEKVEGKRVVADVIEFQK